MLTEEQLKNNLLNIRSFLKKKWNDKHEDIKAKSLSEYNPMTSDYRMCRYTALFIRSALKTMTGQSWEIKGGSVWEPEFPTGGIKDKDGE